MFPSLAIQLEASSREPDPAQEIMGLSGRFVEASSAPLPTDGTWRNPSLARPSPLDIRPHCCDSILYYLDLQLIPPIPSQTPPPPSRPPIRTNPIHPVPTSYRHHRQRPDRQRVNNLYFPQPAREIHFVNPTPTSLYQELKHFPRYHVRSRISHR